MGDSNPAANLTAPRFIPGMSGNPGGKPKASRNRLQGSFVTALAEDFEENGRAAIVACRLEKPDKYLMVIASLMPKEIELTRPLDELTDDQLDAAVVAARAILAAKHPRAGTGDSEGQEPAAGLHPVPEAG